MLKVKIIGKLEIIDIIQANIEEFKKFKNVWSDSKNCYWPIRGSHNLLFTRLPTSQRMLLANCNKFKQTRKKLDADPKTMQQINFTGNLD